MKILHIISGLKTGGAERMLERLVLPVQPGVVHEVVSLGSVGSVGARIAAGGVRVTALGLRGALLPLEVARLTRMIRHSKPDAVQTWLYHADVVGGLAARLAGVRAVAWNIRTADTRRGISLSGSARAMLRASAALSRRVPQAIVYVAEAARHAHEAEGYDHAKGVVLHNGFVLPPEAAMAAAGAEVRAELGIPADARVVGTAGTFTAQKNQVGFIAACAPLLAQYPDLHVLSAGAGNTPSQPALAAAVAATGHADRIHLIGERGDIAACLAALDLFCLASRGEGFPNVVGEAMAVGTPVLTTDVGDAAIIVGDTGRVVPVDDPSALRKALADLLAEPREMLEQRGKLARDRIATRFSLDIVKDRYLMLYRSLIVAEGRA